jgi:hypothetical protein
MWLRKRFRLLFLTICLHLSIVDSKMDYMSYYGVNVPEQLGWLNLGVAHDISDADKFWLESNGSVTSLLEMPSLNIYQRVPKRSLIPGWKSALFNFTHNVVIPRMKNGTAIGVFLGDEICCHSSSCWRDVLDPLSSQLRAFLGPTALLYENECGDSISSLPPGDMLSPDLDLVSVDIYKGYMPSSNASEEVAAAKKFAINEMYPRMSKQQRIMFVPGTFACSNFSYISLEESSQHVITILNEFNDWGLHDEKVAGFNPWHFNNRSHPQHNQPCDMKLGAIAMPKVVEKLREIGSAIIRNNSEIKL